ncbi:MAG: hypothetical protein ABEI13_02075, partial [Candidatus Paceibacteria bacterium]
MIDITVKKALLYEKLKYINRRPTVPMIKNANGIVGKSCPKCNAFLTPKATVSNSIEDMIFNNFIGFCHMCRSVRTIKTDRSFGYIFATPMKISQIDLTHPL